MFLIDDEFWRKTLRKARFVACLFGFWIEVHFSDLVQAAQTQNLTGNFDNDLASASLPVVKTISMLTLISVIFVYAKIEYYKKQIGFGRQLGYSMASIRVFVYLALLFASVLMIRLFVDKIQRKMFKFLLVSIIDVTIPLLMIVQNQKILQFVNRRIGNATEL